LIAACHYADFLLLFIFAFFLTDAAPVLLRPLQPLMFADYFALFSIHTDAAEMPLMPFSLATRRRFISPCHSMPAAVLRFIDTPLICRYR